MHAMMHASGLNRALHHHFANCHLYLALMSWSDESLETVVDHSDDAITHVRAGDGEHALHTTLPIATSISPPCLGRMSR